jgi:peptidoglycan hydrolase-like protein with peptidoglycan-binding domain/tetratricopeptide (TPR) repeat protein
MIALLVGVFVANGWGHAGVSSIAARGRRLRAMKARGRCPWRARGQRVKTRCPRSRGDHAPPAKGASSNHASSRRLDTASTTMRGPARLMSLRFWAPTVSMLALAFPPTALGTPAGSSVRATQSQASRSSTGGRLGDAPLLAPGSGYASPHGSGPVRTLQRRLAAAGYPPGPIDGRYGPLTEGAVIRFQAANGLWVDGIAGPRTLAALASPKLVLLPGAGYAADGSGLVRVLQRRLARAGYPPGPIDGRYGPRTESAVIRFQTAKRLRIDGIAGPQTLSHLPLIPDISGRARSQRAVHRQPRPVRTRATRAPRRTTPAPTPARHVAHPTGSSSTGWLVPLTGLALALLAGLAWRTRRRHTAWSEANRPGPDLLTTARREQPPTDVGLAGPLALGPPERPARPVTPRVFPLFSKAAREEDQRDAAEVAVKLGLMLESRGDLAAAKNAYQQADERGHRETARHLGTLLVRQGDLDAAKRADPIGAYNLGVLLEQHDDRQGAIAAYERADRLGHPAAATNLGVLLEQQGQLAAAQAAYQRAGQRGDADGAFNLALLLGEHGEHQAALRAYQRADRLGHPAAATNLGVLLEQQGQLAAAQAAYQRAEHRGDADGAFNLALLLEEHGDHQGALHAYQRAEQLGDPEIAEIARADEIELSKHKPLNPDRR